MKKVLAIVLVIIMVLGTFVSCGGGLKYKQRTETEECAHIDENFDHICEKCGINMEFHADIAGDGEHICDYCKMVMSYCEDSNKDHQCDECGAEMGTHEDAENDGDHRCDYCKAILNTCIDVNIDHKCDECGITVGAHTDRANDDNHKCEYCGEIITACFDLDSNHVCDECRAIVSSCLDADFNHFCDMCKAKMGKHEDISNDGDHNCDYCKEKITLCDDDDLDGFCDECGAITESYERTGEHITFGSYPQSEVKDEVLKSVLDAKGGELPTSSDSGLWTSYGYYRNGIASNFMWYIDVEHEGEKYRGVYFVYNRAYQADNGYEIETVYWFKYEPISWTILSEKTAEGIAFILCDMIIDAQEFLAGPSTNSYPSNYAQSTIRKWLNETFYNTAFDELQREMIVTINVDNSAELKGYNNIKNPYACEDTQDKIFLLSFEEMTNSKYGFSSIHSDIDSARHKDSSDYAQSQGVHTQFRGSYDKNGKWWLRTPHSDGHGLICVLNNMGYFADDDAGNVSGVLPAMWIKI